MTEPASQIGSVRCSECEAQQANDESTEATPGTAGRPAAGDWIILLLLGLVVAALACRFSFQEEQNNPTFREVYQIDPQTLLTALVEEDLEAFVLLTATPPVYPGFAEEPVEWTVADYFTLAEALYSNSTNQNLQDFKLQRMSFRSACSEIESGFQGGNFSYFKSVPDDNGSSRVNVNLFVDPNENVAIMSEVVYMPELKEWEAIDLQNVRIDAWEALQIAERNGGRGFRESVNDECSVLAQFDTESRFDEWWVTYFVEGSSFSLEIDAQTGDFRIVR